MLLKLKSKSAPDLVHLVDEADARDVVLGRLPPDGFGLRFDAFLAVEHGDRAVEHAQGALDLGREVHVAGRVDQVDRVDARRCAFHGQVVAAELIVMPRFCSSSSKSMTAVPSCTSPILWILPV